MKKHLAMVGALCALVGLGIVGVAAGNSGVKGDELAMMASPQMIVLNKVSAVTVHTNIPAESVDNETVTLNNVASLAVWADDCGHLAARFDVADLGLKAADAVTLTLSGDYGAGGGFAVEDVVRVK